MKDRETFDIPGYKFGILTSSDGYWNLKLERNRNNICKATNMLNNLIAAQETIIVPFSDVDGLTLEEIQKVLNIKGPIIMTCYTSFSSISPKEIQNKSIHILNTFILTKEEVEQNLSTPIDQAMEKLLEDIYPELKDAEKRRVRCFFERYQDKTHSKTEERIQKINIRK